MSGRSWRDVADCGTDAGYQRHRYAGQIPCQPCRQAHADEHRERRHRERAAAAGISAERWAVMSDDQRDDLLWELRPRPVRARGTDGKFTKAA